VGPVGHSLAALAAVGVAPVGALALALRPAWRRGLGERLGARPGRPAGCVWVHAASVGEVTAAVRLLDRLADRGLPLAASTTSWTGRTLLRQLRPELAGALAPLDHPWAVARALSLLRPSRLVFVETELWPSWIRCADGAGIPVLVVSGRISDRSLPRYRALAALVAPVLRRLTAVGARSDADAERFVALGVPEARVSVTGDLKFEPPADAPVLAPELAGVCGGVPLVIAGSTHESEEEAALAALRRVRAEGIQAALVLAPRHPERFEAVARIVGDGNVLRRRSTLEARALADGEVLLLDSVGELAGLWSRAAVGFVGGSLVPRGGHNVLEPVFASCPVLFGPHTENAREAAELLLAVGAAERVADATSLSDRVAAALADPERARAGAARGLQAFAVHRGAAERAADLIESSGARSGDAVG
jgi:3-deoxy-D-manno-octulosonic-acid transferase